MMLNQSIFYQPETILEMQIIVSMLILYIDSVFTSGKTLIAKDDLASDGKEVSQPNAPYVILLLILHVWQYLLDIFKKREIKLYGEPDVYGI